MEERPRTSIVMPMLVSPEVPVAFPGSHWLVMVVRPDRRPGSVC